MGRSSRGGTTSTQTKGPTKGPSGWESRLRSVKSVTRPVRYCFNPADLHQKMPLPNKSSAGSVVSFGPELSQPEERFKADHELIEYDSSGVNQALAVRLHCAYGRHLQWVHMQHEQRVQRGQRDNIGVGFDG